MASLATVTPDLLIRMAMVPLLVSRFRTVIVPIELPPGASVAPGCTVTGPLMLPAPVSVPPSTLTAPAARLPDTFNVPLLTVVTAV